MGKNKCWRARWKWHEFSIPKNGRHLRWLLHGSWWFGKWWLFTGSEWVFSENVDTLRPYFRGRIFLMHEITDPVKEKISQPERGRARRFFLHISSSFLSKFHYWRRHTDVNFYAHGWLLRVHYSIWVYYLLKSLSPYLELVEKFNSGAHIAHIFAILIYKEAYITPLPEIRHPNQQNFLNSVLYPLLIVPAVRIWIVHFLIQV